MSPQKRQRLRADLNCDLAEGEPFAVTRALLEHISSANIACGGHAGSTETMRDCIQSALDLHVQIGAHPGIPGQFGRGPVTLSADELYTLLVDQCRRLQSLAEKAGASLHHIKLHGSLYHATESNSHLRRATLRALAHFPKARLYALAGGRVIADCQALGLPASAEVFADRHYQPDGSLVPRSQPNACLSNPTDIQARIRRWLEDQTLLAIDGTPLKLPADTLCVHSDTPNAVLIAQAAAASLAAAT